MSLSQIRINGIRLGSRLNMLFQTVVHGESITPLYRTLAQDRTNVVCLGFWNDPWARSVFCCQDFQSDLQSDKKIDHGPCGRNDASSSMASTVSTVSVYPHHASFDILGRLMGFFGKKRIPFQHMVSSHAMLSFVIQRSDQEKVLSFFEHQFDLPPTHIPFDSDFEQENTEFVKKRYPETRATYIEKKIKTYGIKMNSGLAMFEISYDPNRPDHLEICGKGLQQLASFGKKFNFTAVMGRSSDLAHLYCVTEPLASRESQDFFSRLQPARGIEVCPSLSVDLISFHGPHFGDRFGIFNTAMACLNESFIPVLLAGCTGASICMVLPDSLGEKAITALEKGFESP